jgi:hypothetical protein
MIILESKSSEMIGFIGSTDPALSSALRFKCMGAQPGLALGKGAYAPANSAKVIHAMHVIFVQQP